MEAEFSRGITIWSKKAAFRGMITATKSILTVFFNPKEFAIDDLLPQDTSFTTIYFVNNVILPLANRHAPQLENIGSHKLHLHFDNSKWHTARHVQEQTASRRCVRVPHWPCSRDLAIADFYLLAG
jgi:hypothetical protein